MFAKERSSRPISRHRRSHCARGALLKSSIFSSKIGGVAEKAIAAEASQESGKTPDQIRQTIGSSRGCVGIPAALGNVGRRRRPSAMRLHTIRRATQKTLHAIVATSQEGLGAGDLAQIKQPAALLSKLEVSATANQ